MTAEQIIEYVNKRLNSTVERNLLSGSYETGEGLKLSPVGEKFIRERFTKSTSDGGFGEYWKSDESNHLL